MVTGFQPNAHGRVEGEFIELAIASLSQQVWCWGRDIQRSEGNWLLEVGFTRIEPPADRDDCSSVYTLQLPQGRFVILRGFGVFYGDNALGGVFLPRFKFQPRYTADVVLKRPPWSDTDLPKMCEPTASQQQDCATLTLNLIDWIREYEVNIVELLGIEYRRATLEKWIDGKRHSIPAEEMAGVWRRLGVTISEDFRKLFAQTDRFTSSEKQR